VAKAKTDNLAKNSYLEQMNASIQQPMHRDTMHIVELEIIKRLKGMGGPVPFIVGAKGSGKTTLLHSIHAHQQSIGRVVGVGSLRDGFDDAVTAAIHEIVQTLAVSLRQEDLAAQVSTAHDRLRYEAISGSGVEEQIRATDGLLSVLADVSAQLPSGIVLLFDDADAIDAHQLLGLTDAVLALSDTGLPIPVVCTSSADKRDSRWTRSQTPFRVRPTVQDIGDLTRSLGLTFEREDLEIVFRHCDGNLYDAKDRLFALGRHLNQISEMPIEVSEPISAPTNPVDPFRSLRKSERRSRIRDKQLDEKLDVDGADSPDSAGDGTP
jgi:AAA ATPase domain